MNIKPFDHVAVAKADIKILQMEIASSPRHPHAPRIGRDNLFLLAHFLQSATRGLLSPEERKGITPSPYIGDDDLFMAEFIAFTVLDSTKPISPTQYKVAMESLDKAKVVLAQFGFVNYARSIDQFIRSPAARYENISGLLHPQTHHPEPPPRSSGRIGTTINHLLSWWWPRPNGME